jgi:hypothetical protein
MRTLLERPLAATAAAIKPFPIRAQDALQRRKLKRLPEAQSSPGTPDGNSNSSRIVR